eukprot:8532312-Pyramimonas_sp.AAC.1
MYSSQSRGPAAEYSLEYSPPGPPDTPAPPGWRCALPSENWLRSLALPSLRSFGWAWLGYPAKYI